MTSESGEHFLIARGAPFYELQVRLGLLREGALNSPKRAAVCVALTAGAPVLLALLAGHGDWAAAMITGPVFLSRFVLFVAICFLMERMVEAKVRDLIASFSAGETLGPEARPAAARLVSRAIDLRNARLPEIVSLVLAILLCRAGLELQLGEGRAPPIWLAERGGDGALELTAPGWWVVTVSSLIFWFLLLRWAWRVAVASWLLARIASLDLRLVATHPDGTGGIAEIGVYPNSFAPFVFAISAVVAASVYGQLAAETLDVAGYGKVMAAWLAIVLAVFSLPLLAFMAPLSALKARTLAEADRLATVRERQAERAVFGRNIMAQEGLGEESDEPPDPKAFRSAAAKLTTFPVSRRALVPLSVAALAPLLVAGATLLPLMDLLKAAKGLLLL